METQQHNSFPKLPHDMLVEIASRCSNVETLSSLRATSNSIRIATYEPNFTLLSIKRIFLVQSEIRNNYVTQYIPVAADDSVHKSQNLNLLDFLPHKVKINAYSEAMGLLLCESNEPLRGKKIYYVCKFVTREWIRIPNPKTKGNYYFTAATGIVVMKANPFWFKVFRLSWNKASRRNGFSYICQVYDSKKPSKWRTLENEVWLDGEMINERAPSITVNGNLHLLVRSKSILAFDSMTEEWFFIPIPVPMQESEVGTLELKLLKHEGKLGLIVENSTSETLTLWVLEDYKNKVWKRGCDLCIKSVRDIDPLASFEGLLDSETGIFSVYKDIMLYNFRDGSYKRHAVVNNFYSVFWFQSDYMKKWWKTAADSKGYMERKNARWVAKHAASM